MFYYLPPVPKRSQKITLQWSNNSSGNDLPYSSQLFCTPLCFSLIYIFPSRPSQSPRYSSYHTRWGFFYFGIGQICVNQNTKPFLFRALIVALCSVSIYSFKKVPPRNDALGQLWCLCFEESPRPCRRQQKAASPETCQPFSQAFWHDAGWTFHFPWKWR